jgi:DNA-binding transcriptional ArsR family regulator
LYFRAAIILSAFAGPPKQISRQHVLIISHELDRQIVRALDVTVFAAIVNRMVKYGDEALDRTFAALADPTRRALLARLGERDGISVSELAQPFAMSLPAIMKHLDVLSDAGLVARLKTGRIVACRLTAKPMEQAMGWLNRYERFWSEGLDRLAAFVEGDKWPNQALPAMPASSLDQASPSSAASTPRRRKSTRRGPIRKR